MGNIFNYDIPKSEQEAHIFAIQLLIPKEELIAFINKGGQTISTCAEHFQAPKGKIREALKLYDLISEEDNTTYYIKEQTNEKC